MYVLLLFLFLFRFDAQLNKLLYFLLLLSSLGVEMSRFL